MKVLDLKQGSDEWLAIRGKYHTASEAPAMMSASNKVKRNELLHMKATGDEKEFSRWVKEVLFERGHRIEAASRRIAEKIIGEELFPATAVDDEGYLLSSFDGITMLEDVCWECKQWNEVKAEIVRANRVPEEDFWQVIQQLVVSGADKLLYMVTDGTTDNTVTTWVELSGHDEKKLIAGWKQFDDDLANFEPTEKPAEVIPNQAKTLPAIKYKLDGLVLQSNVLEYRAAAEKLVEDARKKLETDQDFADAEVRIKSFKEAEGKLKTVRDAVLSEINDVDQFCRDVGDIGELIRQARLSSEKQVKDRKKEIRVEILSSGKKSLQEHISKVNKTITPVVLPQYTVDFAAAMKGKRNIDSLQGAVDDELVKAKIDINAMADEIRVNLKFYNENVGEFKSVFHDLQQIISKPADDFSLIVTTRIQGEKQREEERLKELERQKAIREEDERKRQAEIERQKSDDQDQQVESGLQTTENKAPIQKDDIETDRSSLRPTKVKRKGRFIPTDKKIIEVLMHHFEESEETVIAWLLAMDLKLSLGGASKC